MGWMYAQGKGVPQDDKVAVQWFKCAAEQGHVEAQTKLGTMYLKERGVSLDDNMTVQWYRRAAEQGNVSAQFMLGMMYAMGRGVPQDYIYAHIWINIAIAGGYNDVDETLNFTESQMTSIQIAEAQKLAREYIHKQYKDC